MFVKQRILRTFTGDPFGRMLVGVVFTERGPVVSAVGEQPAFQPFGSRGGHTERQGQPGGCRHTRAERNAAQIPDHQRGSGRVRLHEGYRVVSSR